MIEIETAETIRGFDPAEWNALSAGHTLTSHDWFQVLEDSVAANYGWHYALARQNGMAVGAIYGAGSKSTPGRADLNSLLFGRGKVITKLMGISPLPALMFGVRFGEGDAVLLGEGLSAVERKAIATRLVEAAEDAAESCGMTACFRAVAASAKDLRAILTERGYLATREMTNAYLDVPWFTFDEYRAELRQTHPGTEKNVCYELNLAKKHQLEVEIVRDLTVYGDSLHRLLDEHCQRLNDEPLPYGPGLLKRCQELLGDRAVISRATLKGDLVGVLLEIHSSHGVFLPLVGIDADRGRAVALYFNLVYNSPIQRAIDSEDSRIYFGRLQYEIKAKRGCKAMESDVFLKPRNGLQQRVWSHYFPGRSKKIGALSAMLPEETGAGRRRP